MKSVLSGLLAMILMFSCTTNQSKKNERIIEKDIITENDRIVSLNGTLTELICELGFEKNIIGTDITSTYPKKIEKLPKLGHVRSVQAEGIISLNPTYVLAIKSELKPELINQLKKVGIKVLEFDFEYSVNGTKKLITEVSNELGRKDKANKIINDIIKQFNQVHEKTPKKKVLFIYARGVGTLMVAGKNTQMDEIIKLAGAKNAVNDFKDFKPLTAEALVEANPDIILMFDSGLKSLEGYKGLKNVPGFELTSAGKNKAVITMDGQLLSGFGPRLGLAVVELNTKISKISDK